MTRCRRACSDPAHAATIAANATIGQPRTSGHSRVGSPSLVFDGKPSPGHTAGRVAGRPEKGTTCPLESLR
eukprot:3514869-Pyramimonas_sp.AAC.1